MKDVYRNGFLGLCKHYWAEILARIVYQEKKKVRLWSLRAVTDQGFLSCEQHRETADIVAMSSQGYSLHMFLEDKLSAFIPLSLQLLSLTLLPNAV